MTLDELLTIYRIQFSVLQKYEKLNMYDQRGFLVPNSVLRYYEKQQGIVDKNDKNLEGFLPPFEKCDREEDMRQAYKYFSMLLKEKKLKGEINI